MSGEGVQLKYFTHKERERYEKTITVFRGICSAIRILFCFIASGVHTNHYPATHANTHT